MQQSQDLYESQHRVPKKRFRPGVWGIAAALVGLGLLAGAVWMFCQIRPVNDRHYTSSPFPWVGEQVTINSAIAWWKSAKGDARMEMRTGYYPVARIRLGGGKGKGLMTVTFHDELNRQVGEAIHMPYADGQFARREENWVRAEGDVATCRVEAGYENKQEIVLRLIQPDMPLWKVKVIYRPEGERTAYFLGTVTINPEEVKDENGAKEALKEEAPQEEVKVEAAPEMQSAEILPEGKGE